MPDRADRDADPEGLGEAPLRIPGLPFPTGADDIETDGADGVGVDVQDHVRLCDSLMEQIVGNPLGQRPCGAPGKDAVDVEAVVVGEAGGRQVGHRVLDWRRHHRPSQSLRIQALPGQPSNHLAPRDFVPMYRRPHPKDRARFGAVDDDKGDAHPRTITQVRALDVPGPHGGGGQDDGADFKPAMHTPSLLCGRGGRDWSPGS